MSSSSSGSKSPHAASAPALLGISTTDAVEPGGDVPGWRLVTGLVVVHVVGVIGFMAPIEMLKGLPLPMSTMAAGWVLAASWVLAGWWSGWNHRRWFLKLALVYWVGLTLLMLLAGFVLSATAFPLLVAIVVGLAHGPIDGVSASLVGKQYAAWQAYLRLGVMGAVAIAYWIGSRHRASAGSRHHNR